MPPSNSGMSTLGASCGSSKVGFGLFSPLASPRPPTNCTLDVEIAPASTATSVALLVGLVESLTADFKRVW